MNPSLPWHETPVRQPDTAFAEQAAQRQAQLTKPPGALGELEALAIRLAGLQRRLRPAVDRVHISVFAADHGIAAENVSAFPQAVTAQMIDNFAHGGAAISVAARTLGATLDVIDLGTVGKSAAHASVHRLPIAAGTANFAREAAMTAEQLQQALDAGGDAVQRALAAGAELFIGGEMGIANTSSASALACLLLDCAAQQLAGPGTGLDARGVAHKVQVLDRALALHRPSCTTPLEALRRVGGFEIAALSGAYVAAAQQGLPVLVDGFISSVAALLACRLQAGVRDWMFFAHRSAEPGHALVLEALHARGLLELGMRLGEGSGAAVAVPLLRMACALHAGMATFAEAGVAAQSSH